MKKLRFLIIEQARKENHLDLVRAIEELGHEAFWAPLNAVAIVTENGKLVAYFNEKKLSDFDIIMPRTVSSNLRLGRLVLRLCHEKQYVLDKIICERDTFGKVSQADILYHAKISHPDTLYTDNLAAFKTYISHIQFPCIAKPVRGSQGRGVCLLKNIQEATTFFSSLDEDYLFQQYLPIQYDYRIFTIGKKVLGGIKRFVAPNDIRSNVSIGAQTEPATITPEIERVALQAAQAFGYDVAGVDIAIVGDTHYVFEVNRTPQWQGLKKTLKIDPAKSIVEFCIQQYSHIQSKS